MTIICGVSCFFARPGAEKCLRRYQGVCVFSVSGQDLAPRTRIRQAEGEGSGITFTELDNWFATTEDSGGLQDVCDTLAPGVIRVFCDRRWAGYRCR